VNVLLVEDNDLNRDVATAMLGRLGASVATAHDGQVAVEVVRDAQDRGEQFDVVLMDCQMPVLDGYAATMQIRSDPTLTGLPIVAMTANAMASDRIRALDAGMNGHLSKPVATAQLAGVVHAWASPPTTADELRAAAGLLYGFDLEAALERVPDVAALAMLTQRFADANRDVAAELRETLAGDGPSGLGSSAHKLAGTAGMLGATAVEAAARHLLGLAGAGATADDLDAPIEAVAVELRRTTQTLALLWPR